MGLTSLLLSNPCLALAEEEDQLELEPLTIWGEQDPLYDADRRIREIGKALPELSTEGAERETLADEALEALGLRGEGIQGAHPDDQQRWAQVLERLRGAEPLP